MLSIGKVQRGAKGREYYEQLYKDDYYNRRGSGEPPGQWEGRLAAFFGLRGLVEEEDFCNLFNAESPTGERLRQRRPNERPAFDLTYSAPKDVSTVYAFAGPELKREMDAAMYGAALASFGYVEDEACMTRLGKNGTEVVRGGGLVAAFFPHDMSRTLDPQKHIHAVVFNFTEGPDGIHRSLHASKLYEHKHAAGALFRAELAARLEKLGFEIERDGFSFSIKGVPESLKEEFSKRSEQIRRELGEKETTQKQKDKAAVSSRPAKLKNVDRDKVTAEWREIGERHGFTTERVEELRTYVTPKERDERRELRAAVGEALKQLTSSKSSFTEKALIEQTAVEGQTRGLFADQIRLGVFAELEGAKLGLRDTQAVYLGDHADGYKRFTTKELFKLEQEILQTAERGRHSREHCVSDTTLAKALSSKPTLKAEQVEAVKHITQGAGSVKCVSGWAGTGKTYALDTARLALEEEGYRVLGCALSGKAAKELSRGANIESVTIAKLIYDLDNPGRKDRLTLDSKTVLIVDEAGMVGTRALHRLVTEAEQAGLRLVLVGDDKQLQSIDAGGGFSGLSKRLGYAELKEITRQRNAEDRQAVYDMAEGNPALALKSYAERGRLILGDDLADTLQRLVAEWRRDKTDLKDKLILSSTNHQAAVINRLCQWERQKQGELSLKSVTVKEGAKVHSGDRVLFTRNDKRLSVNNGDLGTVIRVTTADEEERSSPAGRLNREWRPEKGETLTVKLDTDEIVTVALSRYDRDNIRLGYCVTTHKAQGATVEKAYVFSNGQMTDRQMAYVQASRARQETRIYTPKNEAGPELRELTEAMSRDRKKTMAHDTIEETTKPAPTPRPSTKPSLSQGISIRLFPKP